MKAGRRKRGSAVMRMVMGGKSRCGRRARGAAGRRMHTTFVVIGKVTARLGWELGCVVHRWDRSGRRWERSRRVCRRLTRAIWVIRRWRVDGYEWKGSTPRTAGYIQTEHPYRALSRAGEKFIVQGRIERKRSNAPISSLES